MGAQASSLAFMDYGCVPAPNTMIYWLTQAARKLRTDDPRGRKQVHIAAAASLDQSTINRFEQGESWPRNVEVIVAAYAEDLDIEDPRDIWKLAIDLWYDSGELPTVEELSSDGTGERFAEAIEGGARASRSRRSRRGGSTGASGSGAGGA